jgi:hypothetical protein
MFLKTMVGILCAATITTNAMAAAVRWDVGDGGNGHWYELIFESMSWDQAKAASETYIIDGVSGHLATITSADENAFLVNTFLPGQSGRGFWLGGFQLPGQSRTDEGWQWVTGETWDYENWWLGNVVPEPNDWPGMGVEDSQEDYMGFSHESFGQWNDTQINEPYMRSGYFVEVNAVPLPAAFWLFLSAIVAFTGFIKRNKNMA